MKTDKVSFGTRPLIGDIVATNGLPKYKQKLTEGILDAFDKLSKNGIDDQFLINIGPKKGAKKLSTDSLDLKYFAKDDKTSTNSVFKSSSSVSPKSLEKLSKKNISKFIIDSYEELTKSNKQTTTTCGYPKPAKAKVSKPHSEKIEKLLNLFGFDDWTRA